MNKKYQDLIITAVVFVLALVVGTFYMNFSPYSFTDSALLFLSAVIGAGCCWIGLCRKK